MLTGCWEEGIWDFYPHNSVNLKLLKNNVYGKSKNPFQGYS